MIQGRDEVVSAASNALLARAETSFDTAVVKAGLAHIVEDKREDIQVEARDTIDNEENTNDLADSATEKRGVRPGGNIGGQKRGVRPGGNIGGQKRGVRGGGNIGGQKRGVRPGGNIGGN